ncbi:MAG TPA: primosomal protein N' [Phycisphaerae bacterium]|nr:primosomal protein N' [Phycisphaerae bacterium]
MAKDRATLSLLDPAELRIGPVATVALFKPLDRPYSYRIPEEFASRLRPGMRIVVPVGRDQRSEVGMCLTVSKQPWNSTLKPVLSLIDDEPLLSEKMLRLGEWISRYYFAPLGRTLDLMVPAAAKKHAGWKTERLVSRTGAMIDVTTAGSPRRGITAKQSAILRILDESSTPIEAIELCRRADCTPATLRSLASKNLIQIQLTKSPILPEPSAIPRHEPHFDLNAEQRAAINQISTAIAARQFGVHLLYGVTGSGKTEVYVAAIRQALSEDRQAILLVPEIALTTQTVRRLESRFDRVAVLHSGLTGVQRSRAWAAAASGAIPVIIGTRSAVLAPCANLGVIVVDEESEPSYKSQSSPRYHTRDVAIARASLEGIPVILGSAAPSLETWKNVQTKKHYHLIRLPHRVRNLAMPTVHLVDMREQHRLRRGVHLLSEPMEHHLKRCLDRGEQSVLLLNRRGYASFLFCPRCRAVVNCPHCSVHMVLHSTTELAHCHYCHARLAVPGRCQTAGCGGPLVRFGLGTQRVEEELKQKFPAARVRRMDSDIMERASDYADVLSAFERREFDILVGTQMIAKGLDFPFVSFVGVVSADTALAIDDFRSEERTFQLVLQVSGRSGRGDVGGHVVVQTFAADTAAIQHAVAGRYEAFANQELNHRRRNRLPPATRMMRIVLSDNRMTKLQTASRQLVDSINLTLQRAGIRVSTAGPRPCPITRIRDQYRYEVQIIFSTADAMLKAIDLFRSEATLKVPVRGLIVDVDPISLQ